jgi:AAA+ superfamily predicted ATPase
MQNPQLSPTFLIDALAENSSALPLRVEAMILAAHHDASVVTCHSLDVKQYAQLGHCELLPETSPRPESYLYWGGEDHDQLFTSYSQVVWQVRWNDHQLRVINLSWQTSCGGESRDWVIAPTRETAEQFVLDVERKTHEPGEAILVFSNGHWQRNEALYHATQKATFEDLILADEMKSIIRKDFATFLESEDRYRRLGISWRRGALMIGPPGNGKTHCVRALVKELEIASLYVQSLSHHYYTAEQMWHLVFERARGLRPCVLVLEDLDSLVNDENRSFFLNQIDGFEQNHGLIILATTNHPERIDSAIMDRPSRFDRKYHFNLPSIEERRAYLGNWQRNLSNETGWQADQVLIAAGATEGFSFAYLKELVISTVMSWMRHSDRDFAALMLEQATILNQQMRTDVVHTSPTADEPAN